MRSLLLSLIVMATLLALALPGTPAVATAQTGASQATDAAETPAPTTTNVPTASVSAQPDACEPNNTPDQACALPLDAVSGPFTFVPEDDQEFYRLDLPQEASIQTQITVRATRGLDLVLSARQGATIIASGTYSLTLSPAMAGPIILRVENRAPQLAVGETYRIEVRREIIPPTTAQTDAAEADVLENNWSFATAAPIAVGVVYDLTFTCPETRANACPCGDHDYLLVPVKAGVSYLITTFDLDPGVDTVVELFWQSTTPVAGNDDYAPGGLLSTLRWTAPDDGLLGIRVAPRNGALPQHISDETTSGYRFAITTTASELARKLETTIRQQANLPAPTATVAAGTASGGTASGTGAGGATTANETITAGPAIITRATVLRREPRADAVALMTLAPETLVTVRGAVSGVWLSVETDASILPGWVLWSDLQRVGAAGASESGTATVSPNSASQQLGSTTTPVLAAPSAAVGASSERVVVTTLDPALPPPQPVAAARVPVALTVTVLATDQPPTGRSTLGLATPTPDRHQPIARVRIQLVTVFGDVLAEGLTDAHGEVQLSRDVPAGAALHVRIPAWGVELPIEADQRTLLVTIPEDMR